MQGFDVNSFNETKGRNINFSEKRGKSDKPLTVAAPFEAIGNIPGSAARYATDTATALLNPADAYTTVTKLGASILSLVPGVKGDDTLRKEVGQYALDRFGSPTKIAKTIRDDPVGFVGDLSLLLVGGAGAARLAGKTGTATDTFAKVGREIEPFTVLGKGADKLGRGIDATAVNVGRGIQSAGTGVKRQVFDIAFKDASIPKDPANVKNTPFREGFYGEPIKDADIVAQAENAYKAKKKSAKTSFDTATKNANLGQIALSANTLNDIAKSFDNVLKSNAETAIASEKALLKRITSDIDRIYQNPTAESLRQAITRIDKQRPKNTGEGGANLDSIIDNVLGTETGLRGVFDKIDELPAEYLRVKGEYEVAMESLKRARQDLGLGKDLKRDTVLNNLRRTLAVLDNISEESLLSLPGGAAIRDRIAGSLARDIIPEQYLRTAGAAGAIGLAGGATGAGLVAGLSGAGTAATLFSPQLATRLNIQAGRIRPKVGGFRQSILEPLRQFGTTARPIETIQREVEDPLQRRGLL